jgi:hypothetical protein
MMKTGYWKFLLNRSIFDLKSSYVRDLRKELYDLWGEMNDDISSLRRARRAIHEQLGHLRHQLSAALEKLSHLSASTPTPPGDSVPGDVRNELWDILLQLYVFLEKALPRVEEEQGNMTRCLTGTSYALWEAYASIGRWMDEIKEIRGENYG